MKLEKFGSSSIRLLYNNKNTYNSAIYYSDNKYKHLAIYSYTSGSDGSSALQLQWPNKICYCFDGGGSRPILKMESLWHPRSLQNSDFEVWRNKQNHVVHIVQWIMIGISKLFNGLQMKTFSLKTFQS